MENDKSQKSERAVNIPPAEVHSLSKELLC